MTVNRKNRGSHKNIIISYKHREIQQQKQAGPLDRRFCIPWEVSVRS